MGEGRENERRLDFSIQVSKAQALGRVAVYAAVLAGGVGYPVYSQFAPARYDAWTSKQDREALAPLIKKQEYIAHLQRQIYADQIRVLERLRQLDRLEALHESGHVSNGE